MVKEIVSIQLYRGYAVVKGEYWMYNSASEPVRIKVGYPLNSCFNSIDSYAHYLTDIRFDSLYGLRVFRNDEAVTILSEAISNPDAGWENENWFVWDNTFTPYNTTLITVYFIVNTNNTIFREGYNIETNNGFVYLLETGATWKQPIVEGEIRIKLMDDLSLNDIKGLSPDSIFKSNVKTGIFLTQFKNLSPTTDNNIVITYTENPDEFNFRDVLDREDELYNEIDNFSSLLISENYLTQIIFDIPFNFSSTNWIISALMFLLFIGRPALLIAAIIITAVLLVRIIIKKKKRT